MIDDYPKIDNAKVSYISISNCEGQFKISVNIGFYSGRTRLFEKMCSNQRYYGDMEFTVEEDLNLIINDLIRELNYVLIDRENVKAMCKIL